MNIEQLQARIALLENENAKLRKTKQYYHESIAADEIRESLLKTVYENSESGIFIVDVIGPGQYCYAGINPIHESLLGISESELKGKSPQQLVHLLGEETVAYIINYYNKCVETRETLQSEAYQSVKGISNWWLSKLVPVSNVDGKISRLIGISFIITKQKEIENRLRESEERFRRITENARDAIYRMRLSDGHYEYMSSASKNIFGYDPQSFYDSPYLISKLIHPNWQHYFKEEWEKLQKSEMPPSYEYQIIHPSGKEKWIHQRNVLVNDVDGTPIAIEGIVTDITAQKEMATKLHQSEKLLALGQLAGGIAHDFNNQLTGIMGFADLLSSMFEEKTKPHHYANAILTSSKRASDLTQQLLAYSRKGKVLELTVNIHSLIDEVVGLLKRSIQKDIVIHQHYGTDTPFLKGDPSLLQSALLNIAINARDAMPKGGKLIFSTKVVELDDNWCKQSPNEITPGRYIEVGISDTGIGIEKSIQKKIFEPFFTTKPKGQGTGMGLAAVYGTIKSHQGTIHVYSEPGKGTAAKVYFPLASSNNMPVQTETVQNKNEQAVVNKTVLVVDDEEMIRKLTKDILCDAGYSVITCPNGSDAVNLYAQHWRSIDVVLMDVVMPIMGGEEASRAMRQINPDAQILLSSGYMSENLSSSFPNSDLQNIVQKPYRQNDLLKQITDILKTKHNDNEETLW